jgi:hypothetical protein
VEAIVKEAVEKRKKERQRKYEEQLRQLQREVEKAKKNAPPQDAVESEKPPA